MRMLTAAQNDSDLAAAVGRFAQASTRLERAIAEAITRLLPITADMGLAILADNSMWANLDALDRLLALPETAISDDWKQKLIDRIPKVRRSSEDRNRLLHNTIVESEDGYVIFIHKRGRRVAMPIDAKTIAQWAGEAGEHAAWFMTVPYGRYDFSQWGKAFLTYEKKDWPKRP
jgi:hypothetical protein